MSRVLTFKVGIEELEDKIWRTIEITDTKTVAELAYTILASFDSLAYHLYDIKYNNITYDCWSCMNDYPFKENVCNATITKLSTISLKEKDKMVMEYDKGTSTKFIITYLCSRELEKGNGRHYPYVIDGSGRGMIDDIDSYDLKNIIDDIDKKGISVHYFTPGYERPTKYDYRDYDIKGDNILLKGRIEEIKYAYEEE